jgi:hypothetical protein
MPDGTEEDKIELLPKPRKRQREVGISIEVEPRSTNDPNRRTSEMDPSTTSSLETTLQEMTDDDVSSEDDETTNARGSHYSDSDGSSRRSETATARTPSTLGTPRIRTPERNLTPRLSRYSPSPTSEQRRRRARYSDSSTSSDDTIKRSTTPRPANSSTESEGEESASTVRRPNIRGPRPDTPASQPDGTGGLLDTVRRAVRRILPIDSSDDSSEEETESMTRRSPLFSRGTTPSQSSSESIDSPTESSAVRSSHRNFDVNYEFPSRVDPPSDTARPSGYRPGQVKNSSKSVSEKVKKPKKRVNADDEIAKQLPAKDLPRLRKKTGK